MLLEAGSRPGRRPRSTYRALIEEREVEGIEPFPIGEFVAGLAAAFPEARRKQPTSTEIFWLDANDALIFEVYWSDGYALAMMRPLNDSVANRIIDVGQLVDAPLYDPQVNERFALLSAL